MIRRTTISFTKPELKDLGISWALISLAFAILFAGKLTLDRRFFAFFLISAITVGVGFIFHELAHKIVALRYGCNAAFKANYTMLLLALITSFLGIIFAAPGAVVITGHITRKQHGHIAASGPLMNMVLALLFLPFLFFIPAIGIYGATINAFLATFNLLPLPGFDGSQVLRWSTTWYIVLFVASIILSLIFFL